MPYGRYRFLCLPFWLKCSQDIFQRRMDLLPSGLPGLPGILAVHDDMTVYGKDEQAHDAALYNLMNRAEEYGLTFNSTKHFIKPPKIEFFRRAFSVDGISQDPAKIQGMLHLPAPEDTTALQSFLGMVNFMQPFVPYLSHHTAPLRVMLQKNFIFDWTPPANAAFQKLKSLLVEA